MNSKPLAGRYGSFPLIVAMTVILVGSACRHSGDSGVADPAAPTLAQIVANGPQFLVKAAAAAPGIAMDRAGRFLVVWSAEDAGIQAQRFDAGGRRAGAELHLPTDRKLGGEARQQPSVGMDPDGNFVVAWAATGNSGQDIFAQRYSADGVARGATFAVNTTTAGEQSAPSVAVGPDGSFMIAWTVAAPNGSAILAQRYAAGGAALGAEFRVDPEAGSHADHASVAVDRAGGQLVVWDAAGADGYSIVGQRYDANGNRAGNSLQLLPAAPEPRFPGVAIDDAGNAYLTWADGDDFVVAYDGVFLGRYGVAGTAAGQGYKVSSDMSRVHAPRLAIDSRGNVVIAWEGSRAADERAVFARRFRPARPGELVAVGSDAGSPGSTGGSTGGAAGPGPDGLPEDGEPWPGLGGGGVYAKALPACVTYTPERLYMAPAGSLSSSLDDALAKLPAGTTLNAIIAGLVGQAFPIGTLKFDEAIDLDVFSGPIAGNERRIEISDAGTTASCNTNVGIGGCARLTVGTSQGGKLWAGAVTVGVTTKLPSGAILDNYSASDYNDAQFRGQLQLAINGNLQQINDTLKNLEYVPDPDIGGGVPYIYSGSNPEKLTALLTPNAPKSCTADTSVSWEIEVRVLRVNDFPELTPDNPVEVGAPVDAEVTVGNAITNPTVVDPATLTDPDVDEAGPLNQRRMLLIGALSCGQPITQDTNHGFHFGSASFEQIGNGVQDLLSAAGIDDTTPIVGGKTNAELLIEVLDAALPTVDDGAGNQVEISELPLSTGNNFDFKSAFGAIGQLDDMQDAISKIYFQHDKADDTCELLTIITDLGNWGLPLQYIGSPPTGIEIPLLGFDFNTRVFKTQRSATVTGGSVVEGNAGTSVFNATVTLGAAAIGNETLKLSTSDGTATGGPSCGAGVDYINAIDINVAFAVGETSKLVPITICGETAFEGNETLTLTLDDEQNVALADADDTLTISNDDTTLVTLGAVPLNVAEAGGTSTITATIADVSTLDVNVGLLASGTASGADYSLATNIVIPAGSLSASVTLTAIDDALDEANESVIIDIGTVLNATESGTQQVTLAILDDDDEPTVTLGAAPATIAEAAGTSTVTATLDQPSGQDVTVNLALTGTATGADYSLPTSIVVPAGALSAGVTLTAIQDTLDEPNETVIIDIDTVANATESGSQQQTVTISDDDAGPAVTLSAVPTTVAEAAGTSTVTATLAQLSGQDVTVSLALTGTASGTDYSLATGIVIQAGSLNASITLTATQDAMDEPDETVIIDISGVTNGSEAGTQQATVTITDDDDGPAVTLSAVPLDIGEAAGTSTITATLAQMTTQPVTVGLAVSGTATAGDYTLPLTIVVPANTLSASVTLTAAQDATDEVDETVIVDIDTVNNGGEDGTQQVTVTIVDDDDPPTVTLTALPASIAEAAGVSTITATLSEPSSLPVTVNLLASGTATAGDYTLPLSIVVPANSASASVALTATQDAVDEVDENVVVDIASVLNGSETGTQQVTVAIVDDDDPPAVTLSALPASIAEAGGSSTITATLAQVSSLDVTVNLSVAGTASSGDYTLATSILIPAGSMMGSTTLAAFDDIVDEADESVLVDIDSVANGVEAVPQQVSVTIVDDDAAPGVTLAATPASVAEAAGTASFTATLAQASTLDVTVNLAFSGTAGAGDYVLAPSILIPAGALTAGITLTAVQDPDDEADETVVVDIASVTNGLEAGVQQQTVTISDDDGPTVTLGATPASIAEAAGTATLTATLDQASPQDVTVNLAITGTAGGGDYTLPASIVVPAGSLTADITLTATQDATDEPDETVIVAIASVVNGIQSGAQQATVTILDDDVTIRVASVTVGSVTEGDAGVAMVTATVTLNGVANGNETLSLETMDGSASGAASCAAGVDYVAVAGANVSFAAGTTTSLVPLMICGDTVVEGNETFSVMLDTAQNVTIGTASATSTIGNDDVAPTAAPTATATATATPTSGPTASPTSQPTATPTQPPTGSATPGPTPTPGPGSTPTPSAGPTATPSAGPSATPTPAATDNGSIHSGEGRFGGSFDLFSVTAGLLLLLLRRGRLLLAVSLGALLPGLAQAETTAQTTTRVNLRSAPDKGVQVVTILEAGQAVEVLERGPQYSRVAGTIVLEGYLPLRYLQPCADVAAPDCAVTTTVVNVREGKGVQHGLLGRLRANSRVVVGERDAAYAGIRYEADVVGYVSTSYLRDVDPVAATPASPTPAFVEARPLPEPAGAPVAAEPIAMAPAPPAPVAADAATRDESGLLAPRWQLGAALGSAGSALDRAEVQRRFARAGVDAGISDYDGRDVAIELFVRYRVARYWGVQFGYLDLGQFETRFSADPAVADAVAKAAKDEYPVAGDGLTLAAVGLRDFGAWQLTASVGAFVSLDRDIEIRLGGQRRTAEGPGASVLLGVGAAYAPSQDWQWHADLRALDLNGWIVVPTLGLGYCFD